MWRRILYIPFIFKVVEIYRQIIRVVVSKRLNDLTNNPLQSPHYMSEKRFVTKQELGDRLRSLREELALGQQMKQQKEIEIQDLSKKLLRISGAAQVIEELLESITENKDEA